MKMKTLVATVAAATCFCAQAQTSINLGNYQVTGTYALDILGGVGGAISGLEGSAVTYARDRGTLFFVGDEGTGVIEISKTGQTIGNNFFDWTSTGSTNHDTEGLTYLGNGVLVVGEERLQDAYRFTYTAGSTVTLASSYVSISNAVVGNNGMEGISYDPRDGSFVTIKQQSPQDILAGTLTFAAVAGGVSTMTNLFNPALMNVTTLSDVQTLSPVDALAGTAAANNLLVLSLGSKRLIEVDRLGNTKSFFDLSNVLPHNAIEGVTIDENGTIYLVAEQVQDGTALPGDKSQLIVLSNVAAVPEPANWALMLAGAGFVGFAAKRRKKLLR
jgi:uncharacterized protein YjiK